jgi:hypothetical protein
MSEFERTMVVTHNSSPWMPGEEEGLSGDLIGRSSWQQSDGCGQAVRSGSGDALSSGEFFYKRNPKESGE